MSITDELREYVWQHATNNDELRAIADRIDAEHEALRDQLDTSERQKESYREDLLAANRQVHAAYNDGFDDGFASADDWLAQHEDAMAEHGWVRLPKDADGVPIRVGERVQLIGNDPSTVSHMMLADDGWRVYVKYDGLIGTGSGEPKSIRHYHAPTVEDVLREMLDAWGELPSNATNEAIIAEYASKLQLREDA